MYKLAQKLLIPLLLLNSTTSANRWVFFSLMPIGQAVFWIIVILSLFIISRTPYRFIALVLFFLGLVFGVFQVVMQSLLFEILKTVSLGIMFMIVGAKVYGDNPTFLRNQLDVFLAISIPIMLLQISGAHSFFMSWNTEYGHDQTLLDPEDYGKFNKIPVYPTLFLSADDVYYQIGQGRPCGLLYSNNVFSVFIAIVTALVFSLSNDSKIRSRNIILAICITLSMSLMSLAVAMLLYTYFILFSTNQKRKLAIKSSLLLGVCYFGYYIFFPGLFSGNFSEAKFIGSLLTRGIDLANTIGLSSIGDIFYTQRMMIGNTFNEDATYSLYALIFKSQFVIPLFVVSMILMFLYFKRINAFKKYALSSSSFYILLTIVCFITQFAVNYIAAPSFQVILGLAFYPLFKKMWLKKHFSPA